MTEQNKELFSKFKIIHDNYKENPEKWQNEFNNEGKKVVDVIRRYEKMLCEHSEGGMYGKYSSNLADKFWGAVRTYLPKIDFVGTEIS